MTTRIAVKGRPFDPGPAGWNAILPEMPVRPPVDGNCHADWLIVGAGFAGLSAARRLTQLRPKDRVAILEARRVGEGPAGRNSGFMIDVPHDLTSSDYGGALDADLRQIRQNRRAIDFAAAAVAEYGLPEESFARSGKINAAASERGLAHNEAFGRHLTALGEKFALLDATQMREMTGTDFFRGGLVSPGAAMLQPALYVRGLASGVERHGAVIFEDAPVVGLAREGPDWVATTPGGSLTAPRVILAVNGHAESFGFFRGRLMHVFTFASMTRALSEAEVRRLGGAPVWACTPADPMGTTVRRISGTGGARIVIRNTFTYEPDMVVSESRLRSTWKAHDSSFIARFPALSGVSMEYRWGGQLCISRNNVAAVKRLDDGLVSACCQNGLGTTKGTLAGIAAAEVAAECTSEEADELLREPLPRRLPPQPIADWGGNAYIRLNEFRAGIEK